MAWVEFYSAVYGMGTVCTLVQTGPAIAAVASCVLACVLFQIMATEGATVAGEGGGGAGDIGGVPKWVLGVAIGVPVAAALIYILFGPSGQPKKKPKPKKAGQPEESKQEIKSHEKDAKPVEEVKPIVVEESKPVEAEQVICTIILIRL